MVEIFQLCVPGPKRQNGRYSGFWNCECVVGSAFRIPTITLAMCSCALYLANAAGNALAMSAASGRLIPDRFHGHDFPITPFSIKSQVTRKG